MWSLIVAWVSVDRGDPISAAIFWLTLLLAEPLTIGVHEVGHAVVAKLLGFDVLSLRVGRGPEIWARRLGSVRLSLCRYAMMGGATEFVVPEIRSRWRSGLVFLAGALFNLTAAGVLIALGLILNTQSGEWAAMVVAIVAGLIISNLRMMFAALWPWTSGEETPSDGAQILALFRRSLNTADDPRLSLLAATERLRMAGRFTEAADLFANKLRDWPNDPYLLGMVIHCTSRTAGDRAALARYAGLVAQAPAGPPRGFDWHATMTGWLAANIAWSTIKSQPDADLDTADRAMRVALAHPPDAPEVKATLGALHVSRGEAALGERLLIEALRVAKEPNDRADFSLYIAKARRQLGDVTGADEAGRLREHILTTALERPLR